MAEPYDDDDDVDLETYLRALPTAEERQEWALHAHRVRNASSRGPVSVPHDTTLVQAWAVDVPPNPYL